MSGVPPHTHGPPNSAWNHLQVPNYYPRQPQNAHMSTEHHHHSVIHQPTWHPPIEPPLKPAGYSLEPTEHPYVLHSPGVDLTLQKNGQNNGELSPISLSVRDTNKINSLAELTKLAKPPSLVVKPVSALLNKPNPGDSPKNMKRLTKSMDSVIERLNPTCETGKDKPVSVIVQAGQTDETNLALDEEVVSPFSNEDSTDSSKSRRKRKPFKTMRLSKDNETLLLPAEKSVDAEQRRPESAPPGDLNPAPVRARRKTSSESETIANIAAMVQKAATESVSVIKTNDSLLQAVKVPTPAQKKATETFVEVENQLEEMFAGITDAKSVVESDDNLLINHVESVTSSTSGESRKRTRKKGSKTRYSTESEGSSPKRVKGVCKKSKPPLEKPPKKISKSETSSYDSGSNSSKTKGPFVQIRGPRRDSPLSIHIVNSSVTDEDVEKKTNKSKKYHDDGEYRHKVRSHGLHSSTLSNKYDAQTRDATWICVFCKLGPHAASVPDVSSPGDLFGPYSITCNSSDPTRHFLDSHDNHFKSKKVERALTDAAAAKQPKKSKRKRSESFDDSEIYLGMSATSEVTYEVWAHEDCLVWSSGVYLVGPKIVGLEEAVWSACNVTCSKCHCRGANLCCVRRGCVNVMHYGCASLSGWSLNTEDYNAVCAAHKKVS